MDRDLTDAGDEAGLHAATGRRGRIATIAVALPAGSAPSPYVLPLVDVRLAGRSLKLAQSAPPVRLQSWAASALGHPQALPQLPGPFEGSALGRTGPASAAKPPPVLTAPDPAALLPVAGAAPEPGGWALMLLGAGVTGATLRRVRSVRH